MLDSLKGSEMVSVFVTASFLKSGQASPIRKIPQSI
jgi:hypothetical protein